MALERVHYWKPLNYALTTVVRLFIGRRVPDWIIYHLRRMGTVAVRLPNGSLLRLWSRGDDWITSAVWWRGIGGYEPETVWPFLWFAATSRVVIDVGAFNGYFALLAAATNPTARILAIEPHPNLAARIGRNLTLNPTSDVTVLPIAVSDHRRSAEFHIGGPGLPSSSSLSSRWKGIYRSIIVPVSDLATIANDWGLLSLDLVKIDVETLEPAVILGMGSLLDEMRPVIFSEVLAETNTERANYSELSHKLVDLKYQFFELTAQGPKFVSTLAPSGNRNRLLCPAEKVPSWLAEERWPPRNS